MNIELLIPSRINNRPKVKKPIEDVIPNINKIIDAIIATIGVSNPMPITGNIFLVIKIFVLFKNLGVIHKHNSQIIKAVAIKVPISIK